MQKPTLPALLLAGVLTATSLVGCATVPPVAGTTGSDAPTIVATSTTSGPTVATSSALPTPSATAPSASTTRTTTSAPPASSSTTKTTTSTTSTTQQTSTSTTTKATTSTRTTTSSGSVPASELRHLSVPSVGFSMDVRPMATTEMGGAIDPPLFSAGNPSPPVRVSDKGVKPGTKTTDTTYVGCHTSARNGAALYPCNVLIRNLDPGAKIVATTDAGTVTYAVTETRSIAYGDFASDFQTWDVVPNRLVWVMCDVVDGKGNSRNFVIYAKVATS